MIGEVGAGFSYNRQALLDSVGRVSREVIGGYDREARGPGDRQRGAGHLRHHRARRGGAIGLGTLVATVLTGAAADLTGHPAGRRARDRRALRDSPEAAAGATGLRGGSPEIRTRLKEALTRQVHHGVAQSTDRINEAIAPYRRFVHGQQQRINEARGELVATEDALLRLRGEIERR